MKKMTRKRAALQRTMKDPKVERSRRAAIIALHRRQTAVNRVMGKQTRMKTRSLRKKGRMMETQMMMSQRWKQMGRCSCRGRVQLAQREGPGLAGGTAVISTAVWSRDRRPQPPGGLH
jgi:adenylosuccinate lyase